MALPGQPFHAVLLCLLLCVCRVAHGELEIVITRGVEQALPIAVVPFRWTGPGADAPLNVASLIQADLQRSGYFSVMAELELPQRPHDRASINFSDWQRVGMEHLLLGEIRVAEQSDFEIDFRLFDVRRGRQLIGLRVPVKRGQLRWATHQIADLVFEKLTGIRGAFATRIAYITVRTERARQLHSLHVADSDGYNSRVLLESTQPLLSPSWSPDGNRLAYVSFETKNSAVYVQDIYSGEREQVSAEPGINSAPAFSPDGSRLAMTLSREGNPDIYILFLESRILKRLTYHPAIDTEPSWSPDGNTLAFTSDRGGSPQIYTIDANAERAVPRRISFEGAYNARPTWSPNGKYLAMVHGAGGSYRIAVLNPGSGYLNVLTHSGQDESPSFSPNSSMVMYATRSGASAHLAAVAVDGGVEQQLSSPGAEVREPAWGPFLKP